jgi:hypothetical protein
LTFGDDIPRTHGSADAFVERISNPFKARRTHEALPQNLLSDDVGEGRVSKFEV